MCDARGGQSNTRFCAAHGNRRAGRDSGFGVGPDRFVSAIIASVALILCSALWVTLHGALAYGLIRRSPLGARLFWLLVPPLAWLAPYWGYRHHLRWLSSAWVLCGTAYLVLLVVATRWPT